MGYLSEGDVLCKVLLAGQYGSGRSSFLLRHADGVFHDYYISSIGVDFKIVPLYKDSSIPTPGGADDDDASKKTSSPPPASSPSPSPRIMLQIWDTASRERFRQITSSYYRGANGVIFFVDILDRKTIESVISEFKPQADLYCPSGTRYLLVGTKGDRASERTIPRQELDDLAKSWGTTYHEVSARTGEGVDKAVTVLGEDIMKYNRDACRVYSKNPPHFSSTSEEKKKSKGGCILM
eukprot:TRINITY_DN3538_c0_g1_i1.p1 TRINITY_DN3538_c0_g1~~TRINITY_DN3538_c0_g1_i1.p1  ORF type:complete len:250 (+),score=52.28 TRINITY_DN3538_c0_g1_i1:41-751(+)